MKLNTGKIAFAIEFDNGDRQNIYFNPNDPDLAIRMNGLQEKIMKKIEGLEEIELTNEGKPVELSQIETFEKMQNIIKEELDSAFGGNISEVVFKYCSPFAVVNGEYFIVQFIKAITPEIEKHIKAARIDSNKRMAKHIDKYSK